MRAAGVAREDPAWAPGGQAGLVGSAAALEVEAELVAWVVAATEGIQLPGQGPAAARALGAWSQAAPP